MEELRVLFIHPEEEECDAFRHACMGQNFKVETVPNLEEAEGKLAEYRYEMVFVCRKYAPEKVLDFIKNLNQRFPDTECIMGVQTLTKGDLIHYQNSDVSYRMYLEPVNYRVDLMPLIENTMLMASARMVEASDKGASLKEKGWNEARSVLLKLVSTPDSDDLNVLMGITDRYHKLCMATYSRISEIQDELKELYISHSNLTVNWNITENARRVLEYTDNTPKLNMTRVVVMIAIEEALALSGGYKFSSTVGLDVTRNGVRVTVQSMMSNKPSPSGNEYSAKNLGIVNEVDGVCNELCQMWGHSDEFPAGMWMHIRDVIFDA
jgi:hypothetical protein